MVAIFVISLSIILIIPRIREIENGTVKTIVYIVLGLVMFALVGFAFNLWQDQATGAQLIARDIVNPYLEFYPVLILALALAATVMVAYMEKDNYAYFFAGAGFAVLLPDLYQYVFQYGRFDLALLGCALWAVIPMTWAFMWRDAATVEATAGKKAVTAFKASFLTYPVYLLTAVIAVFGESPRGIDAGALKGSAGSLPDMVSFILFTAWLFFLFSIIIVSLMFAMHDLALRLFNYRRVIGATGVTYQKIRTASAKAPPKPKVNHYAGLIAEMQAFSGYIGQVDRIKAASTIGRFKSEYQTLAVKYNEDSKSDAEKMIKRIELEFMQKY